MLAKYYIESIVEEKIGRIDLFEPSPETMLFFGGLLELLNLNDPRFQEYQTRFIRLFGDNIRSIIRNTGLKNKLIDNAKNYFDDEGIFINQNQDYANQKLIPNYINLWIHRWISLYILNKLSLGIKIDTQKFMGLMTRMTYAYTPKHIISIENLDLSGSNFYGLSDPSNLILCMEIFHILPLAVYYHM